MKITKYVHSCLLVQTPGRVALIDPGIYSWESGTFDIDAIERIDRIIITHKHKDHFHPEFVRAVLVAFPEAHIVANADVIEAVKESGITATFREGSTQCSVAFDAPHEALPVLGAEVPHNSGYHFQNVITAPGDSHTFLESKEVLALPIIAPWGNTRDAVELAVKLKPKYVVPIHDWHHSDAGREWLYDLLEFAFEQHNITFIRPVDGESFEISL